MNLFGIVDHSIGLRDVGTWLVPPFQFRVASAVQPRLSYQLLVTSVAKWLQDEVGNEFGIDVRTFPPAIDDAEMYLEMQLSMLDGLPRRHAFVQNFLRCRLRVSCWSRSRTDLGLAGRLSDRIVAALERRAIPVLDFQATETPLWGYVKFREGQRMDFSRQAQREFCRVRRYFEVQVEGIAEQVR